jgi:2-oxoglutarate ferredoxin oxidoreductase subunit gamma
MNDLRIVLAGFGGQGLLFAGKVVAYTGLIEDREVSWLPSYGPEMRGGTANCSVCLSERPIGSPLVLDPNAVIAMNNPSLEKFEPLVEPGGLLVLDTTLINQPTKRSDIEVVSLDATQLAEDAGIPGLGNIILVGKLFAQRPFCKEETLEAAIRKAVPASKPQMVEKNLKALAIGRGLAE